MQDLDVLVQRDGIFSGDAEQIGADVRGHPAGHLLDELTRALFADLVDDVAGDLAETGLPSGDHPRREPVADDLAEEGVAGIVEGDERGHPLDVRRYLQHAEVTVG